MFGLWRPAPQVGEFNLVWVWHGCGYIGPLPTVEPVKKSHQKSSIKKMKYICVKRLCVLHYTSPPLSSPRETVNVPPSLFWRRMAADCLPTKLRKLTSHHSKKTKNKDSFTPLLEQQPVRCPYLHSQILPYAHTDTPIPQYTVYLMSVGGARMDLLRGLGATKGKSSIDIVSPCVCYHLPPPSSASLLFWSSLSPSPSPSRHRSPTGA